MTSRLAVLIAGLGLVVAAAPLAAHHSFAAEYDANKPVTLKGAVTKSSGRTRTRASTWTSRTTKGTVTNWNLELASPNVLSRKAGPASRSTSATMITVQGSLAKDGSKMANARVVTLAAGKRVFAGSSGGDGPASRRTRRRSSCEDRIVTRFQRLLPR